MVTAPTPEVLAEVNNAEVAAEESPAMAVAFGPTIETGGQLGAFRER